MLNYPCPPVGFQFTEENVLKAKVFYALWLLETGLANHQVLHTTEDTEALSIIRQLGRMQTPIQYLASGLSIPQCENHKMLPWVVMSRGSSLNYTFTETPLPEGEIE
jgi:hypothetical protein